MLEIQENPKDFYNTVMGIEEPLKMDSIVTSKAVDYFSPMPDKSDGIKISNQTEFIVKHIQSVCRFIMRKKLEYLPCDPSAFNEQCTIA